MPTLSESPFGSRPPLVPPGPVGIAARDVGKLHHLTPAARRDILRERLAHGVRRLFARAGDSHRLLQSWACGVFLFELEPLPHV